MPNRDTSQRIEGERSIGWFFAEPHFIRGQWHVQVRDPHQPTDAQRRVALSFDRSELETLLEMLDDAETED
jgi:hypothetical protein